MRQIAAALRRFTLALAAIFGFMSFAIPVAQAGMISVERYAAPNTAADQRARVQAFLQRTDVQSQLVALGVDPRTAQDRVAALGEAELARAANLADQPAGADAVGAIVFIFVLLLITDLLGLTDVFSFVRK